MVRAPIPKNVQELRSFLGLLNYYRKFFPNLASLLQPLKSLLQRTKAFKASKDLILTTKVLAHCDPMLPLKLAADTSAYGRELSSHTFYLMDRSTLVHLRPVHSYPVSTTMLKLRRRLWCLGCSISTGTFMVISLRL